MFSNNSSIETQSKHFNSPNYQTLDTDYQYANNNSPSTYKSIKSHQMINTILDTIDEKSADPQDLKKSLSNFDKQFLEMYGSKIPTKHQSSQSRLYIIQKMSGYDKNFFKSPSIQHQNKSMILNSSFQEKGKKHTISQQSTQKLRIPKPNTLTDQFMKTLLGAEGDLIDEYQKTVNPGKYEQKIKEELKRNAKQLFQPSPVRDSMKTMLNFKPGMQKSMAFHDDQYYTYLKTNMKYISQMNSGGEKAKNQIPLKKSHLIDQFQDQIKNQFTQQLSSQENELMKYNFIDGLAQTTPLRPKPQKQEAFSEASPQKIVKKLKQTGGIQNTIAKMESSLKKNELKHLKVNQYLSQKPNPLQKHRQKRLYLDKKLSTQMSIQATKKQPKIVFMHAPVRENVFLQSQKDQILEKKYPRESKKINNPSFFKKQTDQKDSNQLKNWREKSESLRHKIQKSLDRF